MFLSKLPLQPRLLSIRPTLSRLFATIVVKTPTMADSITEGILGSWEKKPGDIVRQDEVVAHIETDKINLPVNSPNSGILEAHLANVGDKVVVGSDLFKLDVRDDISSLSQTPPKESPPKDTPKPKESSPKESPPKETAKPKEQVPPKEQPQQKESIPPPHPQVTSFDRTEKRVRMTPMRQRIAQRLKESQSTAASLTTFNEVDMSAIIDMRNQYKDDIMKKFNVKLGFMSAFIRASAVALSELPMVNSRIDDKDGSIVTPSYVDISVAVATPKGLVTPVIRDCQSKDMIQLEQVLAALGEKAKQGQITMDDLAGGTFTISNGGIFGSLMGTPIINTPQSAILGMHAIKDRPVVVNGQVVSRPMMYLALTYDHRIIDGREAVTFLVRVKNLLEDPRRFLLNI